jgi:hypothetical protein
MLGLNGKNENRQIRQKLKFSHGPVFFLPAAIPAAKLAAKIHCLIAD